MTVGAEVRILTAIKSRDFVIGFACQVHPQNVSVVVHGLDLLDFR
jgi:hypothetical protein